MAVYQWDAEEMNAMASRLDRLAEQLEQEKKMLINSVIVLSDEWRGEAGSEYLRVSSEDVGELENTIAHCRGISSALNKIAEKCYIDCENNIRSYSL